MSISKKQSHIVKDNNNYYFILPDGSDRLIPFIGWTESIDWEAIYLKLYRLIQNKDPKVKDLNKMDIYKICELFGLKEN